MSRSARKAQPHDRIFTFSVKLNSNVLGTGQTAVPSVRPGRLPRARRSNILRMRSSSPHKTIPFFVPHAGCPHDCVFCAQEKITSVPRGEIPLREELENLHALMERCPGGESELAFFGGSFTAIEPERMDTLLLAARGYVDSGAVSGIRISTRPGLYQPPRAGTSEGGGRYRSRAGYPEHRRRRPVRERPRRIPRRTAGTPARSCAHTVFRLSAR